MESERLLELVEHVQASGKVKKGVNEVTKFLERGEAKLVVAATDISPKELIMHLPLLAKEKDIAYAEVPKKEDLGAAAGINRPTAAIAITDGGNAKDMLNSIVKELMSKKESPKEEKKEEKVEEKKEEVKEAPKEEKVEEKPQEEKKEEPAEEKAEEKKE
jgi:large subunit ribosomal protein L7Ae